MRWPVIVARVAVMLLGVVAALGLAPTPVSAAPATALVVSGVTTEPGQVRFLVTPQFVRPGTAIDPGALAVRVGSTRLASSATLTREVAGAPRRVLSVVLDASSSSSSTYRSAIGAAAAAVVAAAPADVHIGLTVVGSAAKSVLDPTADRKAFTDAVTAVSYVGSANPVAGVEAARQALLATSGERRVLLITDGQAVSGGADAGAALSRESIGLDVVSFASGTTATNALAALANAAGGRVLAVTASASASSHAETAGHAFAPVFAVTATVPGYLAGSTAALQVELPGVALGTANATFARAASVAGPQSSMLAWVPTWLGYVMGVLVFAAVILVVLALLWPRSEAHERIKQIAHFGPARSLPTRPEPGQAAPSGSVIARTALAASASVVRSGGLEERIALGLERAGMKMRPHEWLLLRALISVAGAVLFGLLFGLLAVPVGLVLGWLATVAYQILLRERRSRQFAEQLPDALQLVIGSLRSGFSLSQALESLVRESPHPVSAEFGRALAEHRLGADVSDALDRVAQRTGSEDLSWAVMAVRIQRDVGGNLAEILQTSVDTMRERARLRRHVRALSAEGRLSAWVLVCVPLGLAGFMLLYRRSYLMPLFTDPRGLFLVIGGGILFIIGIFWMTRVIKVEA